MHTRRLATLCFAILTSACSHPGSSPSGGPSAASPASSAPSESASPAPPESPVSATPSLSPSGEYDLTVAVTTDTCSTTQQAPYTQRVTLATHPRGDSAIMNVPLVVGPPARVLDGGVAVPQIGFARSDVVLTVGDAHSNSLHPVAGCAAYTEDSVLTVTEVSHDRVRLTRTRTFNDPSSCGAQPANAPRRPANCRQELGYTLALVHATCELPCSGVIRPGDGGVTLECACDAR